MAECPEMVKILEARRETPVHRTLVLDKRLEDARPGQFCMLWLPGVDEKPFSFSNIKGNVAVTVKSNLLTICAKVEIKSSTTNIVKPHGAISSCNSYSRVIIYSSIILYF